MPTKDFFADGYVNARAKFRSAAEDAGAALHAFEHPSEFGPTGEKLGIDVAVIGSQRASRCLLLISGTHGVEGYAGSGCQVGFFRDALYESLWICLDSPGERKQCRFESQLSGLRQAASSKRRV